MSTPPTSRLHIFRAGTYTAMAGQTVTLTPADLAASAAAYDVARHEAPLVVGHPRDNAPAYGWVAALHAAGDDLHADSRDLAVDLAAAVSARRFAKVSASFWPPTHPANPAPGVWSLRHVGFLGAAVPAVLGLTPVAFGDDSAGLVTIEAPLDFSSAPESVMLPDTPPTTPDTPPPADFAAHEAALAAREAAIAERERAAAAQAEALRRTEIASFIGGLVAEGRVLPAEESALVALLATAPVEPVVEFAAPVDAGEPTPRGASAWLREWLKTLPVRVPYGEFAAPDGFVPEDAEIEAAARRMAGLPPTDSQ